MNPGAGKTSASRLCALSAASIPRVWPNSLSNARDWKNVALKPVVASDSMRLCIRVVNRCGDKDEGRRFNLRLTWIGL